MGNNKYLLSERKKNSTFFILLRFNIEWNRIEWKNNYTAIVRKYMDERSRKRLLLRFFAPVLVPFHCNFFTEATNSPKEISTRWKKEGVEALAERLFVR